MTETAWSSELDNTSPVTVVFGEVSSTYAVEITNGDVKPVITRITDDIGDVTISYTLEDDRVGTASIKPMYSLTQSGAFVEMTESDDVDSEGKITLSTSVTGQAHTFVWDAVTDLGKAYNETVWIKIRAYDRDSFIGDTMDSAEVPYDLNFAPAAGTIVSPTDGTFTKNTQLQIVGTIPDPVAGDSDMHIKIEIGTDAAFGTIEKTFDSRLGGGYWEYYDDANWIEIPATGIPIISDPTLIGNQWRFTIDSEEELVVGQKYIRFQAGERV